MNAHTMPAATIERAVKNLPILAVVGAAAIVIRAGTTITMQDGRVFFDQDRPVIFTDPKPGTDYGVRIDAMGEPFATPIVGPLDLSGVIAGFHYAPTGNAPALLRTGGDGVPAISEFTCWDLDYRPDCPDPRGMFTIQLHGRIVWIDAYPTAAEHLVAGTSVYGAVVADGDDLPAKPGGGTYEVFDYATAKEVLAFHGKQLLGAEEFFAAADGVVERASRGRDPEKAGSGNDWRFTSRRGAIDITGSWWQWGTDGHPDDPRPSLFGGSWDSGDDAGSRRAGLGCWAGDSGEWLGARGRSDHVA